MCVNKLNVGHFVKFNFEKEYFSLWWNQNIQMSELQPNFK